MRQFLKNLENKESIVNILFSVYVAIIPIIQYYKSIINAFNLATFLAIIFAIVFLSQIFLLNKGVIRFRLFDIWPILLYLIFVGFNVIYSIEKYGYPNDWNSYSAYVRMLVLMISILILGRSHFNGVLAMKALIVVVELSSVLMIFQLLAGRNFFIAGLLTDERLTEMNARPSGFYMEPAHFAQSAIFVLLYLLFDSVERKRLSDNKKHIVIILGGILLSGSGIGYILVVLVSLFWFAMGIANGKYTRKQILSTMIIILSLVILLPFIFKIPYVSYAISRFTDTESLGGSALLGRTGTNYMYFALSKEKQLLGVGFGHLQDVTGSYYTNSLYSLLIQCGIVGLPFIAILLLHAFIKGGPFIRRFIIVFVLLLFVSTVTAPMELSFYFSFVLFFINQQRCINKNASIDIIEENCIT